MKEFLDYIRVNSNGTLDGVQDWVILAMVIIVGLIAVVAIFSSIVSIMLSIKYVKFNRKNNSLNKTGEEIARNVLDKNGLQDIKVSKSGSLLFGNSYSHYFKKVRLRRLTWKKKSMSSMAMAVQKSSLAVLDKEGDADMKQRIALTPFTYFGSIAFIPLVLFGVLLDFVIFKSPGLTLTLIFTCIGLLSYIISFVLSMLVLKTEKKAQKKAFEIMKKDGIATDEEIEMCKELFHLYNIEYVNDMILALLELILRVLQIVAQAQNSKSSSSKNETD